MGTERGLALVFALALPAAALAHDTRVERTVLIETAAEGRLHVVVQLEVPGESRRQTPFALADRNRDGELDADEHHRVEEHLAIRALDGLRLRVGTATVSLGRVEAKLRAEPRRAWLLLVHGETEIPRGPIVMSLEVTPGAAPLSLRLLAGVRSITAGPRGARQGDQLVFRVGSPDRVEWRLGAE